MQMSFFFSIADMRQAGRPSYFEEVGSAASRKLKEFVGGSWMRKERKTKKRKEKRKKKKEKRKKNEKKKKKL